MNLTMPYKFNPFTSTLDYYQSGGDAFTVLAATGAVNSSNTQFTFTEKPTYIVSDGAWYTENIGWTWNAGLLTATMTIPPNDNIYGFS